MDSEGKLFGIPNTEGDVGTGVIAITVLSGADDDSASESDGSDVSILFLLAHKETANSINKQLVTILLTDDSPKCLYHNNKRIESNINALCIRIEK